MLRTSSSRLGVSGSVSEVIVLISVVLMMTTARPALAESAFVTVARGVAHDLGEHPKSVLVVASRLTSDVPAPRGDELAMQLASLVAAALGEGARAEGHPMSLGLARARTGAGKGAALVYLDVRVDSGELRVTADLYPVIANGWDRIRSPQPPPTGHAYAHPKVTAEVRSYLTPLHLERAHVAKFTHDVGSVLAIACGDVDGAGGNDLVLVSSREVVWGHLDGGKLVAVKRTPATTLGARAPVPLREPLATVELVSDDRVDGKGTLFVGWGDRTGASMEADLVPRTHLAGLPVWGGAGVYCVGRNASRGGFDDTLVRCEDGAPEGDVPTGGGLPEVVDARATLDTIGLDGRENRFVAAREPSGALHLARVGTSETLTLEDAGTAVALADLDQDGVPEVISTMARGEDALVVSSWQKGALIPRLRFAAPAGVDAVAVCPPDADDAPSIVAAVGTELWIVR